ncbi:MAG: hypothetical protein HY369_01785 [Candidatus Aenigmarchaeota archaeon]|nr:hypothetical protein [Candidatus Aenigmarchaeota archaeon]
MPSDYPAFFDKIASAALTPHPEDFGAQDIPDTPLHRFVAEHCGHGENCEVLETRPVLEEGAEVGMHALFMADFDSPLESGQRLFTVSRTDRPDGSVEEHAAVLSARDEIIGALSGMLGRPAATPGRPAMQKAVRDSIQREKRNYVWQYSADATPDFVIGDRQREVWAVDGADQTQAYLLAEKEGVSPLYTVDLIAGRFRGEPIGEEALPDFGAEWSQEAVWMNADAEPLEFSSKNGTVQVLRKGIPVRERQAEVYLFMGAPEATDYVISQHYQRLPSVALGRQMSRQLQPYLERGVSAVVDAASATPAVREKLIAFASQYGARVIGVYIPGRPGDKAEPPTAREGFSELRTVLDFRPGI